MTQLSAFLIGHDTLALNCARMWVEAGHRISAVLSRCPELQSWAEDQNIPLLADLNDVDTGLQNIEFQWILSIANLEIIPDSVLNRADSGAVNFHDGPLPGYAGLNAPVWALLNDETRHGITWHRIDSGIDTGNILVEKQFDISRNDTALSLNTKCFAAAMETFPDVISRLQANDITGQSQPATGRKYFGRASMALGQTVIDPSATRDEILRLVRALDHGTYWNPLGRAKLHIDDAFYSISRAEPCDGSGAPGQILRQDSDRLDLAVGDGAIRVSGLTDLQGNVPEDLVGPAIALGPVSEDQATALKKAARAEDGWRRRLESFVPAASGLSSGPFSGEITASEISNKAGLAPEEIQARFALLAARLTDGGVASVQVQIGTGPCKLLSTHAPITVNTSGSIGDAQARAVSALKEARQAGPFLSDLPLRVPDLDPALPTEFAISDDAELPASVTLSKDGTVLRVDRGAISDRALEFLVERLETLMRAPVDADAATVALIGPKEQELVLRCWNATKKDYDRSVCLHELFERQVQEIPEQPALIFEGETLSYSALNTRANQVAQVLTARGVGRGDLVGLHIRRSADLLIGALAILKAGAGYVPLDPDYPADRVALYVEDSAAKAILTESGLSAHLPPNNAQVIEIDTDPAIAGAPDTAPQSGVSAEDLAYLIFTSGSTGRPKGVMIEHRNVVNFFAGMDDRIAHKEGGTWLAVTSLSFDISVLELFWTLARGMTVVISGDENRTLVSNGPIQMTGRGMEFSLFYWGNDDGVGRDKYRMLLEGAEFADKHGFCAVWTPERHFHAFGGPYPNPSITGAAVAAVTRNLAVRAGSCVAPLHHPARIAEEWAVIDNLTNGRAGLAIASGWQPNDFVLRPENTPPENKPAMYDAIDKLRALWRGEEVEFPMADGTKHGVVTQPRPVSAEIPLWVTTAGNPQTWIEAGEIGANVLTHLLGQSVDEVGEKIKLYHKALRDGGRDPADHKVTLMLHSYIAESREVAEAVAREPMKDYLRSAAGLIKQFAWAFPAFKKPKGVENPMQLDLGTLGDDEMEAILDFAFLRYFEDSGLFGTVEDALARVEELKRIGVDEVACLIDYGIERQKVLDGLRPLSEVLRRANLGDALAEDDFSIAAQIIRHNVTHLQCTPSMARMLVGNEEARAALSRIKHLMIGGEALPGAMVAEIQAATEAHIENMYGPTETTIWSTTQAALGGEGITGVGTPIANTQVYVLDEDMAPVPVGQPGELYIGGEGVARGYWQREDLTAERFLDDPFVDGNRIYRTGDLVRWRAGGGLDFLGRADHQIKLRGYRIELGEIETVIDAQEGIRQSVVLAREDVPGHVQLVAYHLGRASGGEAALKAALSEALPAHMVPARFVEMDDFPLTPNKKIDRKALPAPAARSAATVTPITVQAGTAGKIAAIWGRVLGVEGINPRDHFFDLGGHSLLAVQAHREIRSELHVPSLSITDIFRFPTLSALADRIDGLTGPSSEPAPATTPEQPRAANRQDAMARRRQMRAARARRG